MDKDDNAIDLNTCARGQKLRLRNGDVVEYVGMADYHTAWPHIVSNLSSRFTDSGSSKADNKEWEFDIVEIIQNEKQNG